ncbi:MAG TPA: hypothetical protein ENI35_01380 [Candidatus Desulfofervidus auxilii]|uniref:Uncharacterized protein n=1 Tax=Desulfofervidus auxilii TaxID=1621989 RepID=A0A7C1W2W5_DESA2|nr:hypothetical protein [Candidatus Desulfofervidus auxilii]
MNIAKKYFEEQFTNEDFKKAYLEEKIKLDIEYQLEELKKDILSNKTTQELIKKVDSIKEYLMSI